VQIAGIPKTFKKEFFKIVWWILIRFCKNLKIFAGSGTCSHGSGTGTGFGTGLEPYQK
jgi:hypothetical protein